MFIQTFRQGRFSRERVGAVPLGMKMTPDKTVELEPPAGVAEAKELVSVKILNLDGPLKVVPPSTVALYPGR